MKTSNITCLVCGVLRAEIEALIRQGKIHCGAVFLESLLHMRPTLLEKELEGKMAGSTEDFMLVYGDCHPRMREMQERPNVSRVAGVNCCEILLGKEAYKKLQKEQAFIFLPEWTERWREVFTHELGFNNPENAQSFMKEHRKRLVYVDTGVVPVPGQVIQDISAFFGMPVEVMPVSLDHLLEGINEALRKFGETKPDE